MKKNRIIYCLCIILFSMILSSCGCGPAFLYNWRPKPWTHPFMPDFDQGLGSLINTNGYYVTYDEGNKAMFYSIMFYDNGLCVSLSKRIGGFENEESVISTLNNVYSNEKTEEFYKSSMCWGTYELHRDTIKTFLIENLGGCDGTRKNIVSMAFLISDDKKLKQIFISNSNKEYGYEKTLNTPHSKFYLLGNPLNSSQCPYLTEKWFYQSDKTK